MAEQLGATLGVFAATLKALSLSIRKEHRRELMVDKDTAPLLNELNQVLAKLEALAKPIQPKLPKARGR